MPYSFPSDLRQRIDLQLATGQFLDDDEVLREAISTLERRQQGLRQLTQMVRDADHEIASGQAHEFDAEKIKNAVRQRLHGGVGP